MATLKVSQAASAVTQYDPPSRKSSDTDVKADATFKSAEKPSFPCVNIIYFKRDMIGCPAFAFNTPVVFKEHPMPAHTTHPKYIALQAYMLTHVKHCLKDFPKITCDRTSTYEKILSQIETHKEELVPRFANFAAFGLWEICRILLSTGKVTEEQVGDGICNALRNWNFQMARSLSESCTLSEEDRVAAAQISIENRNLALAQDLLGFGKPMIGAGPIAKEKWGNLLFTSCWGAHLLKDKFQIVQFLLDKGKEHFSEKDLKSALRVAVESIPFNKQRMSGSPLVDQEKYSDKEMQEIYQCTASIILSILDAGGDSFPLKEEIRKAAQGHEFNAISKWVERWY